MESTAIVWLRRDLRLADNPALTAAIDSGRPVILLYVLDESPAVRQLGAASRWWLDKSLAQLASAVRERGSSLVLRRGPAETVVPAFAQEVDAGLVAWNDLCDPGYPERDGALAARLASEGVEVRRENGAYLLRPDAVEKRSGGSFSKFTPYWRAARSLLDIQPPSPAPARLKAPETSPRSEALAGWGLHPSRPDWSTGFDWRPGEQDAQALLSAFVHGGLPAYAEARDRPGVEGTSRLSAHLHWGEISPHAVWRAADTAAHAEEGGAVRDPEKFFSELGWREFNIHLLARHPRLAEQPLDARFARFPFRHAPGELEAWRRGRTGYPIVDAGMRQLWRTGWMHNRVRLIAASFLVKDLLIDWREGERWFWDTLVDADHANNAANWQWVAGSGAEASPWFRIFNPVTQGGKFDPDGDYIRRWIPELASLPGAFIHAPWSAPRDVLNAAGVKLGTDYPLPVVEHAAARVRALEAAASLRGETTAATPSPAPRGRR